MLRPPRKILHRNRTEPVLLAGNAVRRHFIGAVMGAFLPVELDDVGPVAAEHRKHFIENLVDRIAGPVAVQQRKQRMRNAVEAGKAGCLSGRGRARSPWTVRVRSAAHSRS